MPPVNMDLPTLSGTVISYSQVTKYLDCPFAFKCHYVDKIPEKPGIALLFGQLVHIILQKAIDHENARMPFDLVTTAKDQWTSLILQNHIELGNSELDRNLQDAITLCKVYLSRLDRPQVAKTEAHYLTPLPIFKTEKGSYYLQGYVDGVVTHTRDSAEIVDYKTSKQKWSMDDAANELQPGFYGLAMGVSQIDVTYLILLKQKVADVQLMKTRRTSAQISNVLSIIQDFVESYERNLFYPRRGGWKCNSAYCSYYQQCHDLW